MKLLDCPFPELLGEPQVEPEYVWRAGVVIYNDPRTIQFDSAAGGFVSELGAWRDRAASLALPNSKPYTDAPFKQTLADALAHARQNDCSVFILLDDDGTELRRWDLRGHRGEGS